MVIPLTKELTRELTKFPGIIITMTQDGIKFRVARKQVSLSVTWEKILGAAAMTNSNSDVLMKAAKKALSEIRYEGDKNASQ